MKAEVRITRSFKKDLISIYDKSDKQTITNAELRKLIKSIEI